MGDPDKLARLSLLSRDEEDPQFAEPWQAQAFAVVVELIESGRLTQEEWSQRLSAELKAAEGRGEYDTGKRYYGHWLAALERLAVDREITAWNELAEAREETRMNDHHRRDEQLKSP